MADTGLGLGERLITGGGVTSWQDLALHLIARLCGPEHAARTAKVDLLGSHEDGQLPFAALTPRTFARRFRAATGRRPMDSVHAVRVERARQRLEAGSDAVEAVGYDVGYEDPTFFRRLFKRTTGMTPAAYRKKFTPIAAGSSAG